MHHGFELEGIQGQQRRYITWLLERSCYIGPIWLYIWPNGIAPRVEEPALMWINPFPWLAPLEDVCLKTD